MPLSPGTRLGPYEILSVIGSGGMGEVYRARDSKLGRDVALKVLASSVAADPDRLARFRREAQVLAALNHPNIAAIYGFEDSGPTHAPLDSARGATNESRVALVMELVEGQTLDQLLRASGPQASGPRSDTGAPRSVSGVTSKASGPSSGRAPGNVAGGLGPDQTISIARQIAEALEFAHERGIIHRDLKPANVKVRDDGTVKVLDFGLAKALAPEDVSGVSDVTNSPTLTAAAFATGYGGPGAQGIIMGTAAYMAPEQAKGRPVDRRADIWAFGVVLFEMLTGRRGYEAEDVSDTLAAVLTRDVDWQALPADTPARLRGLVRDCLARDPKHRLRDIGEARRVLDQLASGAPDVEPVPSSIVVAPRVPLWQRVVPWTIAALAIIAAAAMAWTISSRPKAPPRTVTRAKYPVSDLSGFVTLSRDGTKLAYTVSGAQGFYLALRQMDQFEAKPLPGTENSGWPIFSPDGEWIAFSSVNAPTRIRKIPITGGTSSTVCDGSFQNGAAWGDDDTIVFPGPAGLMRVPANGGTPTQLTKLNPGNGEKFHSRPQFLPDGRSLLFTITSASPESPQFGVLDLKSGNYRVVARGGDNGQYAATGHLTFVRDATLFAVPFDLARMSTTGPEVPVVEDISTVGPQGTGDYTFSQNGLLVYSEALNAQGTLLVWMDRRGTPQPIAGQVRRDWATGRLSPDGARVVNGIHDSKGTDLWVADLRRSTITRLTFGGDNDFPIWTPDGTHIVYSGAKDGKPGLFSVRADGSGQPELVIAADARPIATGFAPDGQTLLYTQPSASKATIMLLPFGGPDGSSREPQALREPNVSDGQATVSPDGKWVAFTSIDTGTAEIYVQPFPGPGATVRVSTATGRYPRWTRNGHELFYWTASPGNAGLMSVEVQTTPTLTVGEPKELFRYAPGTTWDVAPDGEHFLVEQTAPTGTGAVFAVVTDWFEELRRRAPAKK